jgi:hypothetical protein
MPKIRRPRTISQYNDFGKVNFDGRSALPSAATSPWRSSPLAVDEFPPSTTLLAPLSRIVGIVVVVVVVGIVVVVVVNVVIIDR